LSGWLSSRQLASTWERFGCFFETQKRLGVMFKEKKKTSQSEIIKTYSASGTEGVRELLGRFPGAKQTFLKAIERMREESSDVSELEDLVTELYGVPKEYLESNPDTNTYGTPAEIAIENDISQAHVYIVARHESIRPELYIRVPGGRGKGTSLFHRESFKAAVESYSACQASKHRESYDASIELTSKDVAQMLPEDILGDLNAVSGLVKLFGIESQGSYRPVSQQRGRGSCLYSRKQIEIVIRYINQCRESLAE